MDEEYKELMNYSEKCSKLAEFNLSLSTIELLSTIVIDGKVPTFSLVMCGVCGIMLSYNVYNMYSIEKTQKMLTKNNHN